MSPTRVYTDMRKALDSLDVALDREFTAGRIYYEADVVCSIVQLLRKDFERRAGRWIVGHCHEIERRYPDITVYHAPGKEFPLQFFERRSELVLAAVEVKFATGQQSIRKDLEKLSDLETICARKGRAIISWMVYGDHFNPDIHRANYNSQVQRESIIHAWAGKSPKWRGYTILRCGVARVTDSPKEAKMREVLNSTLWDLDRHSKYNAGSSAQRTG